MKIMEKKYHVNKTLFLCVIATFVFGLLAHGYMFFNNFISHDSLAEFISTDRVINHKISLGRMFVPVYEMLLRGMIACPWLVGILMLFYISFAAFLLSEIFNVKSKLFIVLICGILTVNVTTISAVSTYIHDADCFMLAMLLSVLAVYLWNKSKYGFLLGIIPIVGLLGLYQSYICAAITLIVIKSIIDLLNHSSAKDVIVRLIKGAAMVIAAGVIYIIILKITPIITGTDIVNDEYNSVNNIFTLTAKKLILFSIYAYSECLSLMFNPPSMYNKNFIIVIHSLLMILSLTPVLVYIFKKKVKVFEGILIILLLLSLPIAMNISKTLAANMSHNLMHYAIWLVYILSILLLQWTKDNAKIPKVLSQKKLVTVILCFIIFSNIRTANTIYTYKGFVYESTISMMTRVVDKLESKDDYIPGETPVAMVGNYNDFTIPKEYKPSGELTGALTLTISWSDSCYKQGFFENILFSDINLISDEALMEIKKNPIVYNMPTFPSKESIKNVDGVYVVKFSNYKLIENDN